MWKSKMSKHYEAKANFVLQKLRESNKRTFKVANWPQLSEAVTYCTQSETECFIWPPTYWPSHPCYTDYCVYIHIAVLSYNTEDRDSSAWITSTPTINHST